MVARVGEWRVLRRRLELLQWRTVAAADDDAVLQGIGPGLFCDQRSVVAHHHDLRASRRRRGE